MNRAHPQHVTLRLATSIGSLRKRHLYRVIRAALVVVSRHEDFRIVHFSVQRTHLHLLCEARDKHALARGVRAFEISAARRLHREISKRTRKPRSGAVFPDRYHVASIATVHQVRHTLSYVLNNWRKHREPTAEGLFGGRLDPYSSAIWFEGWRERTVAELHVPAGYEPPPRATPTTWLLSQGWRRARPISVYEVPGSRFTAPSVR